MNRDKGRRPKDKWGWLLSTLLPLAVCLAPSASEGAAPPPKGRSADQLDYLFLANNRPVLLRLHLRVGDKPYTAAFDGWLEKLFVWFDKDKDGRLSPDEVARLAPGNILVSQLRGSIGARGGAVLFSALAKNKHGWVTREEFRAYYINQGLQPLQFSNNNSQAASAKSLNDAIYKRLALSPTGRLTAEKLAGLEGLLRTIDENEDELLSSQELQFQRANNNPFFAVPLSGPGMVQPQPEGLIEIRPNQVRTQYTQQIIRHYDRNRDGLLNREEIGLDREVFDRLDKNGNGSLDATELSAFFDQQPDLVLRARVGKLDSPVQGAIRFALSLGKRSLEQRRAEVVGAKDRSAHKLRQLNSDALAFELGDAHFDLHVSEGGGNNIENVKNFYIQQFDYLAGKKGFVDRAQEKENQNGQYQFLFQIFPQADRDADGKLTKKELEMYLALQGEGAGCMVSLTVNDNGRSLFNVLDANGDGQLSVREMRSAWQRVKPLCKDGEALVQTDLPRMLQVELTQGAGFTRRAVRFAMSPASRVRANTGAVPVWFTKLDRNGDGDISPREWLGTEEAFRAIDADGDGLISGEEARRYEAARKKAEKPDPAKQPGVSGK